MTYLLSVIELFSIFDYRFFEGLEKLFLMILARDLSNVVSHSLKTNSHI